MLPHKWTGYSFRILYRQNTLEMKVSGKDIIVRNLTGNTFEMTIYGEKIKVNKGEEYVYHRKIMDA
jgi:trehalose/maltose hydrolase-like predicted phosphorylase